MYVCIAILTNCKDALEELDQSEAKSMLFSLPPLDVDRVSQKFYITLILILSTDLIHLLRYSTKLSIFDCLTVNLKSLKAVSELRQRNIPIMTLCRRMQYDNCAYKRAKQEINSTNGSMSRKHCSSNID